VILYKEHNLQYTLPDGDFNASGWSPLDRASKYVHSGNISNN